MFQASCQTYGNHRIYQALRYETLRISRKRGARLMCERNLRSMRVDQRRMSLTRAVHLAFIVANQLAQDLSATRPNEKWVTDTTYIPTHEGWLYLVSVMYKSTVVDWAMGDRYDAILATSALDMAIQLAEPTPNLIVYSDRGSEQCPFSPARRCSRDPARYEQHRQLPR